MSETSRVTPPSPAKNGKDPYSVAAVQRALSILDFLATRPHLGAGLSEIAAGLDLPRPTAKRLLSNLENFGYVSQSGPAGSYQLGLRLLEYGNLVASELAIADTARPHIRSLMEDTGETIHLAVLEGRFVVYIDKLEPDRSIRMVSQVGKRLPAHCTALGKAMLAQLGDDRLSGLLSGVNLEQPTRRTAGSLDELRPRLEECRQRGFAIDDEEVEPGLRCIGAAITDNAGTPIGAISLSAPIDRLPDGQINKIGRRVMRAAEGVASDLGRGAPR